MNFSWIVAKIWHATAPLKCRSLLIACWPILFWVAQWWFIPFRLTTVLKCTHQDPTGSFARGRVLTAGSVKVCILVMLRSCALLWWGLQTNLWRIATSQFLVFATVSFLAIAGDGQFLSNTTCLRIVSYDLCVSELLHYHLARFTDETRLFAIYSKTWLDLLLAHVALCRGEEVDWRLLDLKDPFFLYCWQAREIIGILYKLVHDHSHRSNDPFVYHECQLPVIRVWFEADVRLCSIGDGVVATQEALGYDQWDWSAGAVIGSVLSAPGQNESDWNFEERLTGLASGGEQCCEMLNNLQGLVRQVGFWGFDSCLIVLPLFERVFRDGPTLIQLCHVMMNGCAEVEPKSAKNHCLDECLQAFDAMNKPLRIARARID